MNEEDKFVDRVHLVLSALIFGGLLFMYIKLLSSSGISIAWQRFWGCGLTSYLICLFVLRENIFFKRSSKFKAKIVHYFFALITLLAPILFIYLFFTFQEKLMPPDIWSYSFGGAGLAVIVSIFIDDATNQKNLT